MSDARTLFVCQAYPRTSPLIVIFHGDEVFTCISDEGKVYHVDPMNASVDSCSLQTVIERYRALSAWYEVI